MKEEARDALAFLKSELRTIEGLAVKAKDQEEIQGWRDQKTLVLFTLRALTTIVLDIEARLSLLETDGK